ncbi:MAG: hypothetical protein KJO30_10890, partial [Boseongicola sp.]|nr:hypothetical protein [Boseongicola sp.]
MKKNTANFRRRGFHLSAEIRYSCAIDKGHFNQPTPAKTGARGSERAKAQTMTAPFKAILTASILAITSAGAMA